MAEATFLAALLLPPLQSLRNINKGILNCLGVVREPAREALFAIRWLVFRFNLSMGLEKIPWFNGNLHWTNMSYLTRFYETEQPMPTALAWYAHHLPTWFHTVSCVVTWILEIFVPVIAVSVCCSRQCRHVAVILMVFLQMPIAMTGNYSILNWLSVVLCIPLVDDGFFGSCNDNTRSYQKVREFSSVLSAPQYLSPFFRSLVYLHTSLGVILLFRTMSSLDYLGNVNWLLDDQQYASSLTSELNIVDILPLALPAVSIRGALVLGATYHVCGQWGGVFHDSFLHDGKMVMILEVGWDSVTKIKSEDNSTTPGTIEWREIPWRYHVSDPDSAPRFIAPLFPRLDHSVFYEINGIGFNRINPLAPLRNRAASGSWFLQFVQRLLDGGESSLPIWNLMDVGSIEAKQSLVKYPPKYVRAKRYLYRFTDPGVTGKAWWTRADHGVYLGTACKGDTNDDACAFLNCLALCTYTHPEMPDKFCELHTPSTCRLPGGVFRHDDPSSILFELEGFMSDNSVEYLLLSHLISEVPTSYLYSLGNIYDVDRAHSEIRGNFSDIRVIKYILELYESCKQVESRKRPLYCAKLL